MYDESLNEEITICLINWPLPENGNALKLLINYMCTVLIFGIIKSKLFDTNLH